MEVTLSDKSIDLLNSLRYELVEKFILWDREDIALKIKEMDYNDLIMCLHLGFSEMAFFESMRGLVVKRPFKLSEKEIDQISLGVIQLITGGN